AMVWTLKVNAAMVFATDHLPPCNAAYLGQFEGGWPLGTGTIMFSNPIHDQFSTCPGGTAPPSVLGTSNNDIFASQVHGLLTGPSGSGIPPAGLQVNANANVNVMVTFSSQLGLTRTFTTQILQLDVSGGNLPPNIRLRQDPTSPSLGQTVITTIP